MFCNVIDASDSLASDMENGAVCYQTFPPLSPRQDGLRKRMGLGTRLKVGWVPPVNYHHHHCACFLWKLCLYRILLTSKMVSLTNAGHV